MASEAALVARLEVKLNTLERQLKKAGTMADSSVRDIERSFARANPQLGGAVAFGTMLGNLASGGVQVAIRALEDMAKRMRELAETAQFTGMALKDVYGAQQALGGNASQVNAALESVTTLLDKAQRGQEKNALAKLLQVNGQDVKNVKDAGDAWNRVVDIITRLTEAQARDAGAALGISPEIVNKIREAGSEFQKIQQAAANSAPDLERMVALGKDFEDSWNRAVSNIKAAMLEGFAAMRKVILDFLKDTATVLEGLEAVGKTVRSVAGMSAGLTGLPGQAAAAIRDKIAANEQGEGGGPLVFDLGKKRRPAQGLPPDWRRRGGGGGGRDPYGDSLERIRSQTEDLEQETQALGLNTAERVKQKAVLDAVQAARQGDVTLTGTQIAQLEREATVLGTTRQKLDEARQAQEDFRQGSQELSSALSDAFQAAILHGEKLSEVLGNLANRLASRATDKLFDLILMGGSSTGATGGLLGSLFGGRRAMGGPVSANRAYLVGERGPELMVPKASGMVIPNASVRRGAGQTVIQNSRSFNIDARGAQIGVDQQIMRAIRAYDREVAERPMRLG